MPLFATQLLERRRRSSEETTDSVVARRIALVTNYRPAVRCRVLAGKWLKTSDSVRQQCALVAFAMLCNAMHLYPVKARSWPWMSAPFNLKWSGSTLPYRLRWLHRAPCLQKPCWQSLAGAAKAAHRQLGSFNVCWIRLWICCWVST